MGLLWVVGLVGLGWAIVQIVEGERRARDREAAPDAFPRPAPGPDRTQRRQHWDATRPARRSRYDSILAEAEEDAFTWNSFQAPTPIAVDPPVPYAHTSLSEMFAGGESGGAGGGADWGASESQATDSPDTSGGDSSGDSGYSGGGDT